MIVFSSLFHGWRVQLYLRPSKIREEKVLLVTPPPPRSSFFFKALCCRHSDDSVVVLWQTYLLTSYGIVSPGRRVVIIAAPSSSSSLHCHDACELWVYGMVVSSSFSLLLRFLIFVSRRLRACCLHFANYLLLRKTHPLGARWLWNVRSMTDDPRFKRKRERDHNTQHLLPSSLSFLSHSS